MANNIIIYTKPRTLLHKQDRLSFEEDNDKSEIGDYFWELVNFPKRIPKKLKGGEELEFKMYVATEGYIRGYFIIEDWGLGNNGYQLFFNSSSWRDIKKLISTKSFQGFKYANKVPELIEQGEV